MHVRVGVDVGCQIDALILHFLSPLFRAIRADDESYVFLRSDLICECLQQLVIRSAARQFALERPIGLGKATVVATPLASNRL